MRARGVVTKAREKVVEWQEEQQQASGTRRVPRALPPTGLRDDSDNAERKLEKQERGKEAMRKELRELGKMKQHYRLQVHGGVPPAAGREEEGVACWRYRGGSSSKEAPERP